MRSLNNKGFTLMEVLAVVVIIGIIGLISVPSVFSIINNGKSSSYDILVKDITVAAIQLHEEVSFVGTTLYHYDNSGMLSYLVNSSFLEDNGKKYYTIEVNLQTLVSNGFLMGTNNPDKEGTNENLKIITNPKNGIDIGSCIIQIKKTVDSNTFETSYEIKSNSEDDFCPTSDEYRKALNIKNEGE